MSAAQEGGFLKLKNGDVALCDLEIFPLVEFLYHLDALVLLQSHAHVSPSDAPERCSGKSFE